MLACKRISNGIHHPFLTQLIINTRTFCAVSKKEQKQKQKAESAEEKEEEQWYMSGYQALQKKRKFSNFNEKIKWKPSTLLLEQNKWIANATKPHEIIKIVSETVNTNPTKDTMQTLFNCAIRKCAELKAYTQCWQLFAMTKEGTFIDSQIYTTMIWCCLSSPRRLHFNKAFELFQEMKTNNLNPTIYTYTSLMNGCAKALCIEQGIAIWNELEKDDNALPDCQAWNAILSLHSFNTDMDTANKLYFKMINTAHIVPDNFTFSMLLNGYSGTISKGIKFNITDIDIKQHLLDAKSIFIDAINEWNKGRIQTNDKNKLFVIQSWLNVHAAVGNAYTVLCILEWMLRKQISFTFDMKDTFKNNTEDINGIMEYINQINMDHIMLQTKTFGIVLKACMNIPNLNKQNGIELKKLMDCLVGLMINKCAVALSSDIYGMLFCLNGQFIELLDINEFEMLYNEMKRKCKLTTERALNEYARTYLSYMDYQGFNENDKSDFVSGILTDFKNMNVTPSVFTKELVDKYLKK